MRFAKSLSGVVAALSFLTAAPVFAQSDLCANAPTLPLGIIQGTTAGATLDGSSACDSQPRDVWYTYTPTADGVLLLDACGNVLGPCVSVHTACPGTAANQLACNHHDSYVCRESPRLEVNLQANHTYYIRLAGDNFGYRFYTYYLPPKPPAGVGPDVVAGDMSETRAYGHAGDFSAYSFETTACNIGTDYAQWTNNNNSNHHPVISTSMYRLKDGRLEELGYAWLKHGWASGTETHCNYCPATGVWDRLLPGCADSYDAPQNAVQNSLGPRSQVNPTTGAFPYPPTPTGPITDTTSRRVRVPTAAIDPALNAGAMYFAEVHYVTADDAQFGNALNNASYREIYFNAVDAPAYTRGLMQRTRPAILAWGDHDPEVSAVPLDFADGAYVCRIWVAAKAHDNNDGTWTYTYNIFNLNANRAVSSLILPRSTRVRPTGVSFTAPPAHSGEPYSNTPWAWSDGQDTMGWSCTQTFGQNPNANAVRWGTMYTMWFTATTPPIAGEATINIFRPGAAGAPNTLRVGVPVPSAVPCLADFNDDGFIDFQDFDAFTHCFDGETCPLGKNADANGDGFIDFFDIDLFAESFVNGCD